MRPVVVCLTVLTSDYGYEAEGREASPTAAIIDTQAVKATEKGAAAGIPWPLDVGLHIRRHQLHLMPERRESRAQ
jgi:hypothetical protein